MTEAAVEFEFDEPEWEAHDAVRTAPAYLVTPAGEGTEEDAREIADTLNDVSERQRRIRPFLDAGRERRRRHRRYLQDGRIEREEFPNNPLIAAIEIREDDTGADIIIEPQPGTTAEELEAIQLGLNNLVAGVETGEVLDFTDYEHVITPGGALQISTDSMMEPSAVTRLQHLITGAQKRAMTKERRQKQALMQPRDEKGRFCKLEEQIPLTYGHPFVANSFRIPVHVYEGQATAISVPARSTWRQWTTGKTIFTEVGAPDEAWAAWGGYQYVTQATANAGTHVFDIQTAPQIRYTQATYATPDVTWNNWITMGTTTTTSYQATYNWTTVAARDNRPFAPQVWDRWHVTDEEAQARLRELERQRQEAEDRAQRLREARSRQLLADEARLEQAEGRALGLLKLILSTEEWLYYENTGDIRVRGSKGGMFVVQTKYYGGSVHGNVYETDEHGCRLGRVCIAPNMRELDEETGRRLALPATDGFIGQVLAIRHNEAEFRAIGNWSERFGCQQRENTTVEAIQGHRGGNYMLAG